MNMNKLVKSSVATSMALLLLSNTANAEGKITPVSVKKVDDKLLYTKLQLQQIQINSKFHRF